jgi:hypothetical protein
MDDDELLDDDLPEAELVGDDDEELEDEDLVEDVPLEYDADDDVVVAVVEEEEADEDEVPVARKKRGAGEDEDEDDDEVDPDDVEADLDTILKDRIAAGDDEEDEEEVEDPTVEPGERVAAKGADEFTCPTCFLIVHPRQFGRPGALTCPEGYDPCGSIAVVNKINKRAKKG